MKKSSNQKTIISQKLEIDLDYIKSNGIKQISPQEMLLELESCFESDIEHELSDEELEISEEEELGDEFTKL